MSFEKEVERNLANMPLEIPCPQCGKKIRKRAREFKRGVKCPGCGITVQTTGR